MKKYLIELILIGITILTAWWHSKLIKAGRPINHNAWAAGFCGIALLGICFSGVVGWGIVTYIVAIACGRLVAFNLALNRFRGLPLFYTSPTSGSLLDRWQLRLFGSRVWEFEAFLALIFFTLQFFI